MSGHPWPDALLPVLSSHTVTTMSYAHATAHAARMAAGKDAKLRGVPMAVSSATRSRQADRNPNFQAVLAVSQPTVSHSL